MEPSQIQHRLNQELHQVQEARDLSFYEKELFLADILRTIKYEKENENEG